MFWPKPAPVASLPLTGPNPVAHRMSVSPGLAAPQVVAGPPQLLAFTGETRL